MTRRQPRLRLALDTSVAVPLLVTQHAAHDEVVRWWGGRDVALAGHALAETYAVLTRLPAGLRVEPALAARVIEARFGRALPLGVEQSARLPETLAALGIAGGAVYDAMVALAAIEHGAELATRDARAVATYERVGVSVVIVGA